MAKTARAISGDDMELIHEIDSVEVGGYVFCYYEYSRNACGLFLVV